MIALAKRLATVSRHFSANARGSLAAFLSYHRTQQVLTVTVVLYAVWHVTTFWHFGLPGLYLDEAHHLAYIPGIFSKQAALLHTYRAADNIAASLRQFPILGGNVYSSAIDTYVGLPFILFFGFSLESLRLFYALIELMTVLAGALLMLRIAGGSFAALFGIIALTDPLITFAARSDANMFFFVVLFSTIAGHILLTYQRSSAPSTMLPLSCGIMIGWSVMAYFVGAFIAVPLGISALILMRHHLRDQIALVAGMFIGYLPVIYGILSVYLIAPQQLGMPEFAVREQAEFSTFSVANVERFLTVLKNTFGDFRFVQEITGSFDTDFSTVRILIVLVVFCITVAGAIPFVSHVQTKKRNIPTGIAFLAIATLFACATFALKSMQSYHWIPLVFLFYAFVVIQANWAKVLKPIIILAIAALIVVNCIALVRSQQALAQTGGYQLHNESYSLPAILWRTTLRQYTPVFIDWGFNLQFLFQTRGRVPYVFNQHATPSDIKALLKEPGPVAMITWRTPDQMRRLLGDHIETELPFYQRDGVYLYTIFLLTPVAAKLDEPTSPDH
jgi:hypothetical protein